MRKSAFIGILLILSVVLVITRTGSAADFLNFSESYEQSYDCHWEDWELSCGAVDSGRFRAVGRVSLSGIDINSFNEKTPITILIRGFVFTGVLGNDPNYKPWSRSARFVLTHSDGPRNIRYLSVVLNWNRRNLNVGINGKTPQFLDPLMAGVFLGSETGPIYETAFGQLKFSDNVSVNFQFTITGNVATEAVALEGQVSKLSKVELNGLGVPIEDRPMLKPEDTPVKGLTGR
jgi:hypothetical protein